MIKASNLSKRVTTAEGELCILNDISLHVTAGEALALVGPSGSGKSTLLGILAGLDTPSAGTVTLAGENMTAMDEEGRARLRERNVGFVFQSFHLLPGLTAIENVVLPLELRGAKNAMATARQYLCRVGLESRQKHYPRQLSGGEQQRVALARAFACQPRVLFADEPTGNLDAETGRRINQLLFQLNEEEGATLVLVTHEPTLAASCHRVLQLEAGQLVAEASGGRE